MIKHFITKVIFINIIINLCIAARGDIISLEILSTRDVNNNQIYIDNELSKEKIKYFDYEFIKYLNLFNIF